MGMAFNIPAASRNSQTEHRPCLGWAPVGRVCISIDADCLARLMASHQIHVQEFSCDDEASKQVVRGLLLDCLRLR
ncbi:hypothetical protein GCM10011362_14060 [Marinobacter halophilus]|uniref:Uncharacterized protein n=2 Tax=Marinobacter halophilus TaxID=1323740 RepID=A0A2T1KK64_9GAMM|nr:hypothetical protein C7H08_00315 [Marinobacter halophilus]GGC66751.1 hypothetical protein GCM10011362_14060 [Marinobacter halophilus]